jgi:hypothetical protein
VCCGEARHGAASRGGRGETRSDMLGSGGVWYGGRVELRLGRLGSGTARRFRYVGVW